MHDFLNIFIGICIGSAVASVIQCAIWYRHSEAINDKWHAEYCKAVKEDTKRLKEVMSNDVHIINKLYTENSMLHKKVKKLEQREFIEVPEDFSHDQVDIDFGG